MLYHRDIGFPESLRIPTGTRALWYSTHAKQRFEGKYKGNLILPSYIKITSENVIEIATKNNIDCDKIVVRTNYDDRKDMCLVLIPNKGKVVTIWINNKDDKHESLNKEKYNTP
jgi:hypothetical protein